MFLFGKKPAPPINSDEYEKLAKRITDLESELDKFSVKFMSLRGLVHNKGFTPESKESKKTDNISNEMFIADNKGIGYTDGNI